MGIIMNISHYKHTEKKVEIEMEKRQIINGEKFLENVKKKLKVELRWMKRHSQKQRRNRKENE